MKNFIRLAAGVASVFTVATVMANSADNLTTAFQFGVIDESSNGITIEFTLNDYQIGNVDIDGHTYQNITINEGGFVNTVGDPDLPLVSRFVAIPARADVRVEVTGFHFDTYPDMDLAPLQSPEYDAGLGGEFTVNEDLYSRNEFFPQQMVSVGDPAILRDYRVVRLTTYPVQYNPVTHQVNVYDRMTVRVTFEGENPINQKTSPPKPLTLAFQDIYKTTIINYHDPAPADEQMRGIFDVHAFPGTYLIIYPATAEAYLEPYVEWKKRKGHRVFMASSMDSLRRTTHTGLPRHSTVIN